MENGKHHVFNSEHFPKPLELPEDVAKYGSLEGYVRQSLMDDVLTDEEVAEIKRRLGDKDVRTYTFEEATGRSLDDIEYDENDGWE